MNCVWPFLSGLRSVVGTYFEGIDPTFIAGILLTRISRLGRVDSSQTPARCLGAEAALSLGGPGTEQHRELREEDLLGLQPWRCSNNKWAGVSSNRVAQTDETVAQLPKK